MTWKSQISSISAHVVSFLSLLPYPNTSIMHLEYSKQSYWWYKVTKSWDTALR